MTIRFDSVTKTFGDRCVLDQISFEVFPGQILFILGKSGMGKSVTLKALIGMLKPESGKIWIDQMEVTALSDFSKVRQHCGMVFQHPALLDSLDLYDNIALGLRSPQYQEKIGREPSEAEIRTRILYLISLVNLPASVLRLKPNEASYGIQKRISMARTLAPGPKTVLFDEPTTGLDPLSTQSVNQLILDLSRAEKVTSIVVSHDMACALAIADRILFLDQGKVLTIGTPGEICRSNLPLVQEFFQETLSLMPPNWSPP